MKSKKENVLLIVLDAVRKDHLSTYGYQRKTDSFISSFSEESVLFENCFANSNWTPTSHGTIFTGQLPSHSGVYGNNLSLPTSQKAIAEALQSQGYRTFATAAGAHIRADRGFNRGFDEFHETYRIRPSRGFVRKIFSDTSLVKQTIRSITKGHDNYTYYKLDRLKKWLNEGDRPFFGFVNLKTAHHPYNPPRPFKSEFSSVNRPLWEIQETIYNHLGIQQQKIPGHNTERLRELSQTYPIIGGGLDTTEDELEVIKSWYDGAIRYLDSQIESLLSFMDDNGHLENTNVIITADHGEMFGEHGLEKHQYSLYEELLRVPLLIRTPSEKHCEVEDMVSLADLYPTILEMGGIKSEDAGYTQNLVDSSSSHEYLFAEVGRKSDDPVLRNYPNFKGTKHNGPLQSIRDSKYKLIRGSKGNIELYEWKTDIRETTDISKTKPHIARQLEEKLLDSLNQLSNSEYEEEVQDKRLEKQLEDLGYL